MAEEIIKALIVQLPIASVFAYISWQLYQDWKIDRDKAASEREAMRNDLERLNKSFEEIALNLANLYTLIKRTKSDQGF